MRKKTKIRILGIICIILFGLPILSPAIESSFSLFDDVLGLETSTSANFYAISESDYITRWILQNSTLTPIEDFSDDISGSNWDLTGVSERIINTNYIPTDDSHVRKDVPAGNYGSITDLIVWYWTEDFIVNTFIKWEFPYLSANYTSNSTLRFYKLTYVNGYVYVHHTEDFDESTIIWNNQPTTGDIQTGWGGVISGWNTKDIGAPNYYYKFISKDDIQRVLTMYSSESSYKPTINHHLSKSYIGGGYMYMQTNTTELIALKSQDYGTHKTLSSGDYFEVDFQTNSDSQIYLILLKDGIVQKTLVMSQSGNTNFNRHTAQISVSEDLEFDQLKISSTFEDEDYIKVWDIKTYKYTLTGDYADFLVGSKRTHSVSLTSGIYNLRIYDPYDAVVKINEDITIGTSNYFYTYDPTSNFQCRLTLQSTEGINLDITDFHIQVNRSNGGTYSVFDLLDNVFNVDEGTEIFFEISDIFDNIITNTSKWATTTYIDLELDVYSLKIKNLMELQTIIDINTTQTFPILPGELIEHILSKNYYQIGYYDDDNTYNQFTIKLDSNQAYELNRSQICFLSYTDQQGNHLFFEDYKTYINNTLLYENIFYGKVSSIVNINITDRYDIDIHYETYNILSKNNYIPIVLDVYELKLKNMQDEFNYINITRAPHPITGDVGDIVESGHYPATYSFTDDLDGSIPSGWLGSPVGTIVAFVDGHKKVYRHTDGDTNLNAYNNFDENQITGTIEFWIRFEQTNKRFSLFIYSSALIGIYLDWGDDGKLDNKNIDYLCDYSADIWYHYKIVFDTIADTFDLWIDGVEIDTNIVFYTVTSNLNKFSIYHRTTDCIVSFDAIGYSWDSEYLLGDNLHDNFYLGYEPFEQYNATEIGDYYGTESFDYNTESGVYYGTYDFRDETDGTTGNSIDGITQETSTDSTYSLTVTASEDGHKKVLRALASGDDGATTFWTFTDFTNEISGTIEYWMKYIDLGRGYNEFIFYSNVGQVVMVLRFNSATNNFEVQHGDGLGGTTTVNTAAAADTWHHIKVTWDCSTDTYSVWLNGVNIITDENYYSDRVATTINYSRLMLESGGGVNGLEIYIDAYGVSWDTTSHSGLGYGVKWNINPYDILPFLTNDISEVFTYQHDVAYYVDNVLDGHSNVFVYDDSSVANAATYYSYYGGTTYTTGIIEFWFIDDSTHYPDLIIHDDAWATIMHFKLGRSNHFQFFDGSDYIDISPMVKNQWYHIKIDFDTDLDTFDFYVNGTKELDDEDFTNDGIALQYVKFYSGTTNLVTFYLDGMGYSWDDDYNEGDNINSHGKEVISELEDNGWTVADHPYLSHGISGEFGSHKKILNITDDSTVFGIWTYNGFDPQSSGTVEFYAMAEQTDKALYSYFGGKTCWWRFENDGWIKAYDGAVHTNIMEYNADQWYHFKVVLDCGTDKFDMYIDNVLVCDQWDFNVVSDTFYRFLLYTSGSQVEATFYIDAIAYSWDSGYYIGDNYNYYDVDSEYEWTTNIAPEEIVSFRLLKGFYNIWMVNSEETISYSFRMFDDNYFVLNRSQMCFLSYTNQRGEYLNFNQFKTYWNGTLLYENMFYEKIGRNASIEIKDHYDISVKNHSFIVSSGDNYQPVVLTMYSLKVMSQQLVFNHINITRDPNYYESGYSWSEWIAPGEIIDFRLFAGYYKINLTNNEAESSTLYAYTLSGDDILLISSNNTIYNVLVNIANVNTTIGNLITYVQINLTNQNTAINNSIINIEVYLGTVNSTLGNLLVSIDLDITSIANNISTLYVFTENNFINLGNNINTSFISIENNIISINQSISNLVIGIDSSIFLVNGTISTMITQIDSTLLLMNLSIDTALFDLDTTLFEIGNNITDNYILLDTSITLVDNSINDSRIAIINNLLLINNTISNLISSVYSSVYMINNSIYTAVVDVGTSLLLINNTISGNLSIILEMNDALTALYRKTMFSSLLNWTDIGYNTSLIVDQIDAWDFINHYKNESIVIHLRYQDLIEELLVTANNYKTQYLPAFNTEYNLWSVAYQEYLDEWKPLPENKTVDFGFYEAEVPLIPRPLEADFYVFMAFVIVIAIGCVIIAISWANMKSSRDETPEETRLRHKRKRKVAIDRKKGFMYDHT